MYEIIFDIFYRPFEEADRTSYQSRALEYILDYESPLDVTLMSILDQSIFPAEQRTIGKKILKDFVGGKE